MKRGCFMDTMCKMTAPSIKMAVFMDKVAELMVLSTKRDVFMDERIAQKKRHPSKGCLRRYLVMRCPIKSGMTYLSS